MNKTSILISNAYSNFDYIVASYIEWYVKLDNFEKEVRAIDGKRELFKKGSNTIFNMDTELTMQILLLNNVSNLKQLCAEQLTMYIYSYLVVDSTNNFYEGLYKIYENSTEKQNQEGGGPTNLKSVLIAFMSLILFQCVVGINSDINGLIPSGNLKVNMHTSIKQVGEYGKSIQIFSDLNLDDINIENDEDIEKVLNLFKPPFSNKPYKESTLLVSPNISDKIIKKNKDYFIDPSILTGLVTAVGFSIIARDPNSLNGVIDEKIKGINKLSRNVTASLKAVCRESFAKLSTDELPKVYYKVFNKKMSDQEEEQEEQLKTKKMEIEEETTALVKKTMQYDEATPEPSMPPTYKWAASYVYPSSDQQTKTETSVEEYNEFQTELQERVSQEVEKQMGVESNIILNMTIQNSLDLIRKDIQDQQLQNNVEVVFQAICDRIEPIIFNFEDGVISVTDNAKPLQYLNILASNVRIFGKSELERLGTSDPLYNQVDSLFQKSEILHRDIIPSLNHRLKNAVEDKNDSQSIGEFTDSLETALTDIQKSLNKALEVLPITNEKMQILMDHQKEEMIRFLRKERHEQDLENKDFEVSEGIRKDQRDITNQYLNGIMKGFFNVTETAGGNIKNATEMGAMAILNMTGNIAVDLGEVTSKIIDSGFGPIINSLLWTGGPFLGIASVILVLWTCLPYFRGVARLKARQLDATLVPKQLENIYPGSNLSQSDNEQSGQMKIISPYLQQGWWIRNDERGLPILMPPIPKIPAPPTEPFPENYFIGQDGRKHALRPGVPPPPQPPTIKGGIKKKSFKGKRKHKRTQRKRGIYKKRKTRHRKKRMTRRKK